MGRADGPYTVEQIHERIGDKLWAASRRLGVAQKEKVRQIDDPSKFSINACTTTADKIPVAGVDAIANHIKLWADKIPQARADPKHVITALLSTGEVLQGTVHAAHLHPDVKLGG
jgi:putative NIF3 family GTP cyclohydrolase 1 type 2